MILWMDKNEERLRPLTDAKLAIQVKKELKFECSAWSARRQRVALGWEKETPVQKLPSSLRPVVEEIYARLDNLELRVNTLSVKVPKV